MTPKTSHDRPAVPDDSPNPEQAARIADASPEGVPAHPEAGPRQIALVLAATVIGLLAVALAIALAWSPLVGGVLGALALLLFVGNPAVWAATVRAKERRDVEHAERTTNGHEHV